MRAFAAGFLGLVFLSGCLASGEFVVAPAVKVTVIDSSTGEPVAGARVRYAGSNEMADALMTETGVFRLQERTEYRSKIRLPVSGVFRDSALIEVSAEGLANGFARSVFINGLGATEALYPVTVLLFPEESGTSALRHRMKDCLTDPESFHAVDLLVFLGEMDLGRVPGWLDQEALMGIEEHIRLTLPSAGLTSCGNWQAAYETYQVYLENISVMTTVSGS